MPKYLIVYKRDNELCWLTLRAETVTEVKKQTLQSVKIWKENNPNSVYALVDVVELSGRRTLEADWRDEYV